VLINDAFLEQIERRRTHSTSARVRSTSSSLSSPGHLPKTAFIPLTAVCGCNKWGLRSIGRAARAPWRTTGRRGGSVESFGVDTEYGAGRPIGDHSVDDDILIEMVSQGGNGISQPDAANLLAIVEIQNKNLVVLRSELIENLADAVLLPYLLQKDERLHCLRWQK